MWNYYQFSITFTAGLCSVVWITPKLHVMWQNHTFHSLSFINSECKHYLKISYLINTTSTSQVVAKLLPESQLPLCLMGLLVHMCRQNLDVCSLDASVLPVWAGHELHHPNRTALGMIWLPLLVRITTGCCDFSWQKEIPGGIPLFLNTLH